MFWFLPPTKPFFFDPRPSSHQLPLARYLKNPQKEFKRHVFRHNMGLKGSLARRFHVLFGDAYKVLATILDSWTTQQLVTPCPNCIKPEDGRDDQPQPSFRESPSVMVNLQFDFRKLDSARLFTEETSRFESYHDSFYCSLVVVDSTDQVRSFLSSKRKFCEHDSTGSLAVTPAHRARCSHLQQLLQIHRSAAQHAAVLHVALA